MEPGPSSCAALESLRPFLDIPLPSSVEQKLSVLLECDLSSEEGRNWSARVIHSLSKSLIQEYLASLEEQQMLAERLWASLRVRSCGFLGPKLQARILALLSEMLGHGEMLSLQTIIQVIRRRLGGETWSPVSHWSVSHVVQILYRANAFTVTKRRGDSALLQLRPELRAFDDLRLQHDLQILQIAAEDSIYIGPELFSQLLYGQRSLASHLQFLLDVLETPISLYHAVKKLFTTLRREGNLSKLSELRPSIDKLCAVNPYDRMPNPCRESIDTALGALGHLMSTLSVIVERSFPYMKSPPTLPRNKSQRAHSNPFKTFLCWDFSVHDGCPRGEGCTFAHSLEELDANRDSWNYRYWRYAPQFAQREMPNRRFLYPPPRRNVRHCFSYFSSPARSPKTSCSSSQWSSEDDSSANSSNGLEALRYFTTDPSLSLGHVEDPYIIPERSPDAIRSLAAGTSSSFSFASSLRSICEYLPDDEDPSVDQWSSALLDESLVTSPFIFVSSEGDRRQKSPISRPSIDELAPPREERCPQPLGSRFSLSDWPSLPQVKEGFRFLSPFISTPLVREEKSKATFREVILKSPMRRLRSKASVN